MPFGLLELGLQILFAIHAARTGRMMPWLYVIMFLPGIGCLLYGVVVLLPEITAGRSGRTLHSGVVGVVAPGRAYRALAREVAIAPTVFNKRHLAEECLRLGRADGAVALFRECLTGLHAGDPALRLGLARALFHAGDPRATVRELDTLGRDHPAHRTAEGHLLYARALDGAGFPGRALEEYAALAPYFAGEEARCRYGELLARTGAKGEAQAQYREIVHRVELAGRTYRRDQRPWYDQARRAVA